MLRFPKECPYAHLCVMCPLFSLICLVCLPNSHVSSFQYQLLSPRFVFDKNGASRQTSLTKMPPSSRQIVYIFHRYSHFSCRCIMYCSRTPPPVVNRHGGSYQLTLLMLHDITCVHTFSYACVRKAEGPTQFTLEWLRISP